MQGHDKRPLSCGTNGRALCSLDMRLSTWQMNSMSIPPDFISTPLQQLKWMMESWVDHTALLPDGLPSVGRAAKASVPRCCAQFYAQQCQEAFQFDALNACLTLKHTVGRCVESSPRCYKFTLQTLCFNDATIAPFIMTCNDRRILCGLLTSGHVNH